MFINLRILHLSIESRKTGNIRAERGTFKGNVRKTLQWKRVIILQVRVIIQILLLFSIGT